MSPDPTALARQIRRLYSKATISRIAVGAPGAGGPAAPDGSSLAERYRNDPVGYANDVLRVMLTTDQERILRALPGRVKVNSGHNIGKGHPVDTVIDTPDGRRRWGDLRPGDRVFGSDGRSTEILDVYRRGRLPVYRVTFDDNSSVVVDGDHLWVVYERQHARDGGFDHNRRQVLSTAVLASGNLKYRTSDSVRRWALPVQPVVEFQSKPIPVPAYTIGVFLGDGTCHNGTITSADQEIIDVLESESTDGIRVTDSRSRAKNIRVYGLAARLRAMGLLGGTSDSKAVPSLYMHNDAQTRLAVLQGLMDTDGTCNKSGRPSFGSTSWTLVKQVAWLVRSLGGKAFIQPTAKIARATKADGTEVEHKPFYRVQITLTGMPLFRLKRKQSLVADPKRSTHNRRLIDRIELVGEAEVNCIRVAAADSVYLTSHFVPTHNTFLAAVAVNWWFDTRNPGVVITTAPTERDVVDLLWTEIRLQRHRAGLESHFTGPRAPEMFDTGEHWAKGYTARKGESFQGRHRPSMLFVFDECEAVEPIYWQTTQTMFKPGEDHAWLAIGNPITTSSQSYLEDIALDPRGNPKWQQFNLSCLNHPNIQASLRGEPLPIPDAVTLPQVEQYIQDWAQVLPEGETPQPQDLEWPPGSGRMIRPGPLFLGRVLGIRPSGGVDSAFPPAVFDLACRPKWSPRAVWERNYPLVVAVDASGYGDDDTGIHVRCGPLSLHHESHNGWGPGEAAGRARELAVTWTDWYNSLASEDRPPRVPGQVDIVTELDGGYGLGVVSHFENEWVEDGMHARGINMGGGSDIVDSNGGWVYYNMRAEVWLEGAKAAARGDMDLSRLPPDVLAKLRLQLTTPFYITQPDGSRLVEPKKEVKKRLGRSPDDADALLICYSAPAPDMPSVIWGAG